MSEGAPTARDDPDPIDRLLELAVFAPVGLLLSVRESLPDWVARGRQQVSTQLPLARAVGEMAVRYGSKQARQSLERLRQQADDLLDDMAANAAGSPGPERPDRAGSTGPERPDRAGSTGPERPEPPESPPPGAARPVLADDADDAFDAADDEGAFMGAPGDIPPDALRPGSSPDAGELPIPGYDTLSASQVVQRLPGLSLEELEAIRSYELAGRARKTVLLRVAQLRTAS